MSIIKRIAILFILGLIFLFFLALTNPQDLPISLVLVPFIFLALLIFNFSRLIMAMFRLLPNNTGKQRAVSTIMAVILTNFAVLNSIGKLTLQDIILAFAITLIVSWYVAKFQVAPR